MNFVMPSASVPGRVDVIVEGPYGYGKLTENVRLNTWNPFLSGSMENLNYEPYQFPFLSGIEVI